MEGLFHRMESFWSQPEQVYGATSGPFIAE
jgi:hypothetical protein